MARIDRPETRDGCPSLVSLMGSDGHNPVHTELYDVGGGGISHVLVCGIYIHREAANVHNLIFVVDSLLQRKFTLM